MTLPVLMRAFPVDWMERRKAQCDHISPTVGSPVTAPEVALYVAVIHEPSSGVLAEQASGQGIC